MSISHKRHGCSKFRIMLPIFIQIPLFIFVSLALRSMCGWAGWFDLGMSVPLEPLLQTEGFGAIQNLTVPDGTFVFPVLGGLLGIANLEEPMILTCR